MQRYVIEIMPEGVGAEQWNALDSLYDSLLRIIDHLVLADGDMLFHPKVALVIKTDEPRLGVVLGMLAGENEPVVRGPIPMEIRDEWVNETVDLDALAEGKGNEKKPRLKRAPRPKIHKCSRCGEMRGVVNKLGICAVCRMNEARLAKMKAKKEEATEGGNSLGG